MSVALNSLTSPGMVAATLACLGSHAHLSEISKRDIWCPARVAQERPDVQYKLVAIDLLPVPVRSYALWPASQLTRARACPWVAGMHPVTLSV